MSQAIKLNRSQFIEACGNAGLEVSPDVLTDPMHLDFETITALHHEGYICYPKGEEWASEKGSAICVYVMDNEPDDGQCVDFNYDKHIGFIDLTNGLERRGIMLVKEQAGFQLVNATIEYIIVPAKFLKLQEGGDTPLM